MICATCGSTAGMKTITPGSLGLEIAAWLFLFWTFVIPIGYSLWRFFGKTKGCAKCGSTAMVPKDSPMGLKLLKDMP